MLWATIPAAEILPAPYPLIPTPPTPSAGGTPPLDIPGALVPIVPIAVDSDAFCDLCISPFCRLRPFLPPLPIPLPDVEEEGDALLRPPVALLTKPCCNATTPPNPIIPASALGLAANIPCMAFAMFADSCPPGVDASAVLPALPVW
jgi:hypothetical protein